MTCFLKIHAKSDCFYERVEKRLLKEKAMTKGRL